MREYGDFVACPCCGEKMQFGRRVTHVHLPALDTFECKPCGFVVSSEAVSSSYAMIERRHHS
jgi:rubredoxin